MAAYLSCYAAGGWHPGLDGLRALRGGTLDVDLLMCGRRGGCGRDRSGLHGALLIAALTIWDLTG